MADSGEEGPARLVFSESKATPSSETADLGFDQQRPLFQLFGGWIVTATRSGLVLVDQHRAHTRILYERLSSRPDSAAAGRNSSSFPPTCRWGLPMWLCFRMRGTR